MKEIVTHNIKPIGSTFHYDGKKYHVVAHVRDSGRFVYMLKFYMKNYQYWQYEAMDAEDMDAYELHKMITK